MKDAAPGLDTHKLRNDPNDNLALAGRAEAMTKEANETVNEKTPEEKRESLEQLVGPNVTAAAKELGEDDPAEDKKAAKKSAKKE
jgi:hypothetical protein